MRTLQIIQRGICSIRISGAIPSRKLVEDNVASVTGDTDWIKITTSIEGILTLWTEGADAKTTIEYYRIGENSSQEEGVVTFGGAQWDEDNNGIIAIWLINTSVDHYVVITTEAENDYSIWLNFHNMNDPDNDADGFSDAMDNCKEMPNPTQRNTDKDAEGDMCDGDMDGDEVLNEDEDEGCELLADCDGDTISDKEDNCDLIASTDQRDTDKDEIGDACDIDDDGDGLIELWNAPMLHNVRHAPNGTGYREDEEARINHLGCGGQDASECYGYELITDISLARYANWLPVGDADASFQAVFNGNGHSIRDLNIRRPAMNDIGLFGVVGENAILRNVTVIAGTIKGRRNIGVLVGQGSGDSFRIESVQVEAEAVSGKSPFVRKTTISTLGVGGMVGVTSASVTINDSSVQVESMTNSFGRMGGMIGCSNDGLVIIRASSVRVKNIAVPFPTKIPPTSIGGMVGGGVNVIIVASSVQVDNITDAFLAMGGMVGYATNATIIASSVQAKHLEATTQIGGIVGATNNSMIIGSFAQVGSIVGEGNFVAGIDSSIHKNSTVITSYAQANNISGFLGINGISMNGRIIDSYWNGSLMGFYQRTQGMRRAVELSAPIDYDGIYANWTNQNLAAETEDALNTLLPGLADFTRWCDTDASGMIETDEMTDQNRLWDFGDSTQHPLLRCVPIGVTAQREWFNDNRALIGVPSL